MIRKAAIVISLFLASGVSANPWTVVEGSTLLDGTETATYVAGYMFSGAEYEYTSSQINLRCIDETLEMSVIGDGDLISATKAEQNPTITFVFKVGEELVSFDAAVDNPRWSRERARVHEGPQLLEYLRQHDGESVQVQLPVARTGVPEVRKLSLENVTAVTDLILATCGPLETWGPPEGDAVESVATEKARANETPIDLETAISIGLAQKVVETLIKEKGVKFEQIIQALGPLTGSDAQ